MEINNLSTLVKSALVTQTLARLLKISFKFDHERSEILLI